MQIPKKNLMAKFNEYKEYVKSSGEFMTLKQGENKIRVVSEFEQFQAEFQGKLKGRFMGYVIDRTDGRIKQLTVGPQIFGAIGELSLSSEYGFDGLPPYDVIIKKTGDGIDTEYTVIPARQNTELTSEEKAQLETSRPIIEIVENMQKKNPTKFVKKELVLPNGKVLKDEDISIIDEEKGINPEDIPF